MTLPAISGADHWIADYPGYPCPVRPKQVPQLAPLIEPFSVDAPLLAGARGKAFMIAGDGLTDNSVWDDRLLAERPTDLDERLPPPTALHSRGHVIAQATRIG